MVGVQLGFWQYLTRYISDNLMFYRETDVTYFSLFFILSRDQDLFFVLGIERSPDTESELMEELPDEKEHLDVVVENKPIVVDGIAKQDFMLLPLLLLTQAFKGVTTVIIRDLPDSLILSTTSSCVAHFTSLSPTFTT